MGDISSEPSMEEILSSIKRIIAEEGDAATGTRTRRPAKAATTTPVRDALSDAMDADDEVLELSDAVAEERATPAPMAIGAPDVPSAPGPKPVQRTPEAILSERAADATRAPLEALSRMVVKPEVAGSDTLEGLVRELLKPMLQEWLDENLPRIVEGMVAREISRITGR
jgi:cell pole-organizing protein PopZ